MLRPHKNIKILFNYFLGPLLGAWLFYSLYKQIKDQQDLHQSILLIKEAPFADQSIKFWTIILLVFVNWGLEARKWQLLMKPVQSLNYLTAYKAVLSGITLSLNTPNRIGEYGGRILYVKEGNRIKAVSLSIAGSLSQLIITLLMGCGGLIFLIYIKHPAAISVMGLSIFWLRTLLLISAIFVTCLLVFYFRISGTVRWVEKIPAISRFVQYIHVLEQFRANLLLRLLSLSFLRFIVFVIQYILLLQVLRVSIPIVEAFWIITILFLVLAIVPSFAIADLGIRGKISTGLLSLYSTNFVGIIGTTFGIWFINLFIPAVIGSVLIIGRRIFKEK
ncbi:MAG: flippase-like domain-containing protein [Chitinophagaceae bacterium]|nr:flippase-like domain-containing protein [Chitinophagaceae bacterium]